MRVESNGVPDDRTHNTGQTNGQSEMGTIGGLLKNIWVKGPMMQQGKREGVTDFWGLWQLGLYLGQE